MLTAFAKHGRFDLVLGCRGDLWIDDHHTAEDCALAVGEAIDCALGGRKDIRRWGSALCPLDEALARAVIDISSRPWYGTDWMRADSSHRRHLPPVPTTMCRSEVSLDLKRDSVGGLSCEMIRHVFMSLATAARITLHVDVLRGANDHHKAEASFKALGVALREAVAPDVGGGVPSTKGVLA